jgi:hypothetical protein
VCKLANIYAFLSATRPTLPIPWIFYFSGRRTHGFVAATVPNDKPSHILIIFIPTYNCNNQQTHISTQWAFLISLYIFNSYFIHFICTADYDVSILTRACHSWTHFFPQLPKDINPVVLDPDIDRNEVSTDNSMTKNSRHICTVGFAGCTVAAYWNNHSCSSAPNKEVLFTMSFW